jgi:hypothetical protein
MNAVVAVFAEPRARKRAPSVPRRLEAACENPPAARPHLKPLSRMALRQACRALRSQLHARSALPAGHSTSSLLADCPSTAVRRFTAGGPEAAQQAEGQGASAGPSGQEHETTHFGASARAGAAAPARRTRPAALRLPVCLLCCAARLQTRLQRLQLQRSPVRCVGRRVPGCARGGEARAGFGRV